MANSLTSGESGEVWRTQIGPLLSIDDAALAISATRAVIEQLIAAGELLALSTGEAVVLPSFQFADGKPLPGLGAILAAFEPAIETPFTVASWFSGPQPELDADTPASWLANGGDPECALLAARRTAASLAQ